MDILDTGGSYVFPAMRSLAIKSADGFILVCASDDPASLEVDFPNSNETLIIRISLSFFLLMKISSSAWGECLNRFFFRICKASSTELQCVISSAGGARRQASSTTCSDELIQLNIYRMHVAFAFPPHLPLSSLRYESFYESIRLNRDVFGLSRTTEM